MSVASSRAAGQSRLISLVSTHITVCLSLSVTSSNIITHFMPNSTNAIYMNTPKVHTSSLNIQSHLIPHYCPLRSSNLTLLNRPLRPPQPPQRLLPIRRQFRPSQRRHTPNKKPRTPLYPPLFTLPRLPPLTLLNLCLENCGASELARSDGFSDAGPVAEGFVGELRGLGWEDLGGECEGC